MKMIMAIIVCTTITILAMIAASINSDLVIERMVKNGADPIKAFCAIHGVAGDSGRNIAVCLEAAKK